LVTLRDAALYLTKLPKAEHDAEKWLAAMEALLLVAESDGPTMLARIGVCERLADVGRKPRRRHIAASAQRHTGSFNRFRLVCDLGLFFGPG